MRRMPLSSLWGRMERSTHDEDADMKDNVTIAKLPLLKRLLAGDNGEDAPESSAARRSLRDVLIEKRALEAALIAGAPQARSFEQEAAFWRNVLRWRVQNIGKASNLRDMVDATIVREVL